MTWFCYSFATKDAASNFHRDIAEGYKARGIDYCRSYERPKRKKGGYWVAVCAASSSAFDALSSFYGGERLNRRVAS